MYVYFLDYISLYNGDLMKNKSVWLDKCYRVKYPCLENDLECDVLIIGGGITGISCGYFLKDANLKIVIVEANQICTGTTGKSTGKLTYLQDDMINKIKKNYTQKTAELYIDSQKDAIKLAKKIIIDNNIDCNLEPVSSYIFSNNAINNKINQNYHIYKAKGNVKKKNTLPINVKSYSILEANDTYVFNPAKFCIELGKIINKKINIYEKTRIINIEKKKTHFIAKTQKNSIICKKIILACHYPFFIIPYFFPFKTSIEKSFLCAGEVENTKPISLINVDNKVVSIRYYNDKKKYIIFLSNNKSLNDNNDDLKKREDCIWNLRSKFSPNVKYCWSNHDIMTFDYLPFIGEINDNLYIATGYNTWGLTSGLLSGKIIFDIIFNNDNKYIDLFNPKRSLSNVHKLINYNFKNTYAFIKNKLFKQKQFYNDNVKITYEDGKCYGIYIDDKQKEHKVLNLCPHMKCNLYFNYQNKTWDCPCHGSSFDIDGNIIYGPSKCNIKK